MQPLRDEAGLCVFAAGDGCGGWGCERAVLCSAAPHSHTGWLRHRVSAVSDWLGGISAGLCDDGGVARLITIDHLATAERTDGAAAQQAEERKAAQNNARDGDDGDQPGSSSRATAT